MSQLEIVVNGEPTEVEVGSTVADLVDRLGLRPEAVAVERNGAIVPRATYGQAGLAACDRLEVVGFVQGGADARI